MRPVASFIRSNVAATLKKALEKTDQSRNRNEETRRVFSTLRRILSGEVTRPFVTVPKCKFPRCWNEDKIYNSVASNTDSRMAHEDHLRCFTMEENSCRRSWTDDQATGLEDDNNTLKVIHPACSVYTDSLECRTYSLGLLAEIPRTMIRLPSKFQKCRKGYRCRWEIKILTHPTRSSYWHF